MAGNDKKAGVERTTYIVCTVFTLLGTAICVTCLLLPYWYEVKFLEGQVHWEVNVGLWQDRVCEGDDSCEWKWVEDYDRPEEVSIPKEDIIKWMETIGSGCAVFSCLTLMALWKTRFSRSSVRNFVHVLYFGPCVLAGFLTVCGTLILASKGEGSGIDWAAFLVVVGGAFLFLSACMACVVCRYDPSYGTVENPVSPKYIVTG